MTRHLSTLALAVSAAALAPAAPAMAVALANDDIGRFVQTGSFGDMRWEARSLIVAMTPTRDATPAPPTHVGGGNPIFIPSQPANSGIGALIMDYGVFTSGPNIGANALFICTGTLTTRFAIVTAGHCVFPRSDTSRASPLVTAYFNTTPDVRVPFNATSLALPVATINIHPSYTGQVIDHFDVAILQLASAAPASLPLTKMLLNAGPDGLRGEDFTVKGYGNRSIIGGCGPLPGCASGGATGGTTGFLREGDNLYDYRMGDPIFSAIPGNGWQTVFPTNPNIAYSYISDFDSGNDVNSQACRVAQASNLAQAAGAVFCDTGRGAREVSVAGGDSGGPGLVGGRIATVTSYGLSFGTAWGDCRAGLQSSCGELNGFAPLYISRDWILSVVPAPGAIAVFGLGLGLLAGLRLRRAAA